MRLNNRIKFIFFLIVLTLCWLISRKLNITLSDIRALINSFPLVLSGGIFILLYVTLTSFIIFGPKDVLRIAGAIVFGGWGSMLLVSIAEMFNLAILFTLSRKLGRGFIEERFQLKASNTQTIKGHAGAWGILALRLNLLFPLRLLDLGYGLSAVDFKKYFFISLITTPFRVFIVQAVLAGIGEAVLEDPTRIIETMTSYMAGSRFIVAYSSIYFLLVVILSGVAVVLKTRGSSPRQSPPS